MDEQYLAFVIGGIEARKTSLLGCYTGTFLKTLTLKNSDDHGAMEVDVDVDDRYATFILEDTSGQEHYPRLRPLKYHEADIFIVCYSVVSRASFEEAVGSYVSAARSRNPHAAYILVGTEKDIREDEQELGIDTVSTEEAQQVAAEQGFYSAVVECSIVEHNETKEVLDVAIAEACRTLRRYRNADVPKTTVHELQQTREEKRMATLKAEAGETEEEPAPE